jgi:hypothetical protein
MIAVIRTVFVIAAAAVCLLLPARADEAAPDNEGGRYAFNKVASGVLRLDGSTGEVSLCSQRAVGWACQAAPEDRAVFENEIARLRHENATLKKELLSHGLPLPAGAIPEPPLARDGELTLRLPSDDEVERALAFAGRVWHRFVDAIARAQKQLLNKS